jgi:adenylate kinase family enzyme
MHKIIIIGCGGAGKSTLARKLKAVLGIEVYHLDALYWKPGWKQTADDEWKEILGDVLLKDAWIIDGNFGSTMEWRAQAADTIIFLDYSTIRCLYGIFKRRIMYHGKVRPDMTEGCPERLDWEFVKWVGGYKRKKAPEIVKMLHNYRKQGKKIYHFASPAETEAFLSLLTK